MKKYLKLIRVPHYIKNIIIFFPLFFSGALTDKHLLLKTTAAFFAFSFLSSVIYIINDIRDVENDRLHPVKKHRPIASGQVTVKSGIILGSFLFIASCGMNFAACGFNLNAWLLLGAYLCANLAYSFGLKNVPIIDIAILALGFMLRMLYGASVGSIEISHWLYLTLMAAAFYLGMGKRRNEIIIKKNNDSRKVLKYYNYNFLDKNMYMSMALAILFYSLWTIDSTTVQHVGSTNLIWSVPLVILICMKYSLSIEGNSHGDPVEVILKDKALLALGAVLGAVLIGTVYF